MDDFFHGLDDGRMIRGSGEPERVVRRERAHEARSGFPDPRIIIIHAMDEIVHCMDEVILGRMILAIILQSSILL